MKRPDDVIRRLNSDHERLYGHTVDEWRPAPFSLEHDLRVFLPYVRHLEEENKRLRGDLDKFDRPYTGEMRATS